MSPTKLKKEVLALKQAFENGELEKVILLSPQLLVQIIEELASIDYELWRYDYEKFERDIPINTKEAYEIISNLYRKSSDKLYIAEAILTAQESNLLGSGKGKSFKAYYTKLEQLVNTRNLIAHDYYTKKPTMSQLKIASKAGMSLLDLFINHEQFSTNA